MKTKITLFFLIIGLFCSCDKDITVQDLIDESGSTNTSSYTLSDGLVAYYPFDGDASDKSMNGNNGVVYGATLTSDRHGNKNSAYSFDGINDYINVPDAEILQITGQITMCAWIKTDYSTPYDAIINKINPNAPSTGYGMCTYEDNRFLGKIYKNHSEGVGAVLISDSTIADNKWHLLGFTYDGRLAKLYLDNKLIGTMLYTNGIQKNTSPLLIGFDYNTYLGDRHFKGIIDDVRIYNRALSSSEINNLYNLNPKPSDTLSDGLVAYYPFNGDASDKSMNGNNGVVYGATLTSDRHGNKNSAYSFDGINDYINVPDAKILQITGQITLCAWIKTDYSTPYDAIINKINPNAPSTGYGMCTYEDNRFLGKIYKNHSEEVSAVLISDSNIADNKWHLLGFTYDGRLAKLYLDNKLIGTMLYTDGIEKNTSPLLIGFDYNTYLGDRHFKGIIDDVRIYNRALSSLELGKLYDIKLN